MPNLAFPFDHLPANRFNVIVDAPHLSFYLFTVDLRDGPTVREIALDMEYLSGWAARVISWCDPS